MSIFCKVKFLTENTTKYDVTFCAEILNEELNINDNISSVVDFHTRNASSSKIGHNFKK